MVCYRLMANVGSPPRVRSRQPDPESTRIAQGITSACAEQTDWLDEAARK